MNTTIYKNQPCCDACCKPACSCCPTIVGPTGPIGPTGPTGPTGPGVGATGPPVQQVQPELLVLQAQQDLPAPQVLQVLPVQ